MVDLFTSRLSACEKAIADMEACLYNHALMCTQQTLIAHKKMVLVYCSYPGSQESKMGSMGLFSINTTATCAYQGNALLNPVTGASSTDGGDIALASCDRTTGRRLDEKELAARRLKEDLFTVSDGRRNFTVSSVDYAAEKDSEGELTSVSASLTGPEPAFEFDVRVDFSPFYDPKLPVMPDPTKEHNGYWFDAELMWAIGVMPQVKEAMQMAKAPSGGRAVLLQGRRLAARKRKLKGALIADLEKARVAMYVMKVSQDGVEHLLEKREHATGRTAMLGTGLAAVLLVVSALGVCRRFVAHAPGASRSDTGYKSMRRGVNRGDEALTPLYSPRRPGQPEDLDDDTEAMIME